MVELQSSAYLELLDWRRRVADLFAELRRRSPDADTLAWFRSEKDALFRTHSQSPLPPEERSAFAGLRYWPFDPRARVAARWAPLPEASPEHAPVAQIALVRVGRLEFALYDQPLSLDAYWIEGYAGGLFVAFRDATSGHTTYGGGRYLLDTVKSADLGADLGSGTVQLDFNYAYHPSCTYDARWACPLAPRENWLGIAVHAGERLR